MFYFNYMKFIRLIIYTNSVIMRKSRLLCVLVLYVISIQMFAESYTITKTANENLSSFFTSTTQYFITELKIVGELNGSDFYFIRKIASSKTNGNLAKIDLSEASFVDIDNISEYQNNKYFNPTQTTHPVYEIGYYSTHNYFFYVGADITTTGSGTGLVESFILKDINMVPSYAFYGCDVLKEVVLSQTTSGIGQHSFDGCKSLNTINIPESLKTIEGCAFQGCSSLKVIDLSRVITLGSSSFSKCSYLQSVVLSNATSIGPSIFEDCKQLKSVILSDELKIVPYGAFSGCNSLKTIDLPLKMKKLGSYAFLDCDLDSIVFPPTTEDIGCNAFWENSHFSKIYCLATLPPTCDTNPFGYDEKLYVPKGCKERYLLSPEWKKFTNVEEISEDMFPSHQEKCEKPVITFVDGSLHYDSSTPNVKFVYLITSTDIHSGTSDGKVPLSGKYMISVYATAEGFKQSETTTATLYWVDGSLKNPTNINSVQSRGVLVKVDDGHIILSGLNDTESVSFYSLDGKLLGKSYSLSGIAQFSTNEVIVIAKIGKKSIKLYNK